MSGEEAVKLKIIQHLFKCDLKGIVEYMGMRISLQVLQNIK